MSEINLPQHVGYIVDGNRRWAKRHGLDSQAGHEAGYKKLEDILLDTIDRGVPSIIDRKSVV